MTDLCLSSPTELSDIEPNVFLRPFLEVVRSEDTTGPITGLALTSVNKFLSYGLISKYLDISFINNDSSFTTSKQKVEGDICWLWKWASKNVRYMETALTNNKVTLAVSNWYDSFDSVLFI